MIRLRTVLAGTACCLLLAACDIPTDVPIIETRWIIPVEETTLGVDELLPSGITVSGSNFDVSIDPFSTSETLNTLCEGCSILNGLTVPAPAFADSFDVTENLPADVSAATIASGSVQIVIQNGFSFDPIAGGGTFTVTLRAGEGGAQLGQIVIDGTSETMGAGSTLTRTLTIGASSIGTTFFASVNVVSPGGQTATIDTNDEITVTATTTALLVSSATVNVQSQSVSFAAVQLDVGDIGSEITDRIVSGAVILDVTNPFGVSVTGSIVLGPTTKTFSISASATSEVTISYTGDELRSFLGQDNVTFSGSGTASGGSVTVSPGQEMVIDASVDLTLTIGG
jgi:hypothetical protein